MWLPLMLPTGDLALNPSMCPDWELNRQPFCLQAGTQPPSHTSQGPLTSILKFCSTASESGSGLEPAAFYSFLSLSLCFPILGSPPAHCPLLDFPLYSVYNTSLQMKDCFNQQFLFFEELKSQFSETTLRAPSPGEQPRLCF